MEFRIREVMSYLIFFLFLTTTALQVQAQETKDEIPWKSWGVKKHSAVGDHYQGINKVLLTLSSEVRVLDEKRPMIIDYHLNNIKLEGAGYHHVTITVKATAYHQLTGHEKELQSVVTYGRERNTVNRLTFPAVRSGGYSIVIHTILLDFEKDNRLVASLSLDRRTGQNKIVTNFRTILHNMHIGINATSRTQRPGHHIFGGDFEIPIITEVRNEYSIQLNGNLLILPKVNGRKKYIFPHLLGDTHTGDASRCEDNSNAYTVSDNLPQQAETYLPVEAWKKLGKPLVAMNANFFDTRSQKNNSTWVTNGCSSPLGVYYDNVTRGPTGGTHNSPNKIYAGLPYLIDPKSNSKIALDTMLWFDDAMSNRVLVTATSPEATNVESEVNKYINSGFKMVGVSGVGIHNRMSDPSISPDNAEKEMMRTAISINEDEDMVFIFQGGDQDDGLDRNELYGFFKSLNAENAMEFTPGAYSAIVTDDDQFVKFGALQPLSTCHLAGTAAWCSKPANQEDGHQATPSWLGISNH